MCVLRLAYRQPRHVICVSSQVGCPYQCEFCRSGHRAYFRNLEKDEILAQVRVGFELVPSMSLFDVTYMGVGEPLANVDQVVSSFQGLFDEFAFLDRVNISTIGPVAGLRRLMSLATSNEIEPYTHRVHLQISLHSPFDRERRNLFRQPLGSVKNLVANASELAQCLGDTVCFNYLLFENVNDTERHIDALVELLGERACYVKVSEYNAIAESQLIGSSGERAERFARALASRGLKVKVFRSAGTDVRAGCGQLVGFAEGSSRDDETHFVSPIRSAAHSETTSAERA